MTESSQFVGCEQPALEMRRKCSFENKPTVEEEPPTKKGTISTITQNGVFKTNLVTIPEQKQKVLKCKHHVMRRKSTMLTVNGSNCYVNIICFAQGPILFTPKHLA